MMITSFLIPFKAFSKAPPTGNINDLHSRSIPQIQVPKHDSKDVPGGFGRSNSIIWLTRLVGSRSDPFKGPLKEHPGTT